MFDKRFIRLRGFFLNAVLLLWASMLRSNPHTNSNTRGHAYRIVKARACIALFFCPKGLLFFLFSARAGLRVVGHGGFQHMSCQAPFELLSELCSSIPNNEVLSQKNTEMAAIVAVMMRG